MKLSALRIERLLAKVEAEFACSARARRYVFHPDEVAEAEAQGLPYVLVPRVLSREGWEKKYGGHSAGDGTRLTGRDQGDASTGVAAAPLPGRACLGLSAEAVRR
jgi:hypothetical protein